MSIYNIFYFIVIFNTLVLIIYVYDINDYILYNQYNILVKNLKKRLFYYTSKYKNCNSTQTPLYCGHKYEGYKVQKKGLYPESVLVNISNYKQIKTLGNTICKNNIIIIGVVCSPDHFLQRLSLRMG